MNRSTMYAVLVGCALASSCGSSGTTPVTPSTPAPTAAPCLQTVIFQGSAAITPLTADFETFTTTTPGRLDVTLDWTLPTSTEAVFVVSGPCSFENFRAGSCNFLLSIASPPKPLKGSIASLAPGTYTLILGNASNDDESVAIQVVLSTPSCPALTSVGIASARRGAETTRSFARSSGPRTAGS